MTATAASDFDDARARRASLVLGIAHALYSCTGFNFILTGGLVGLQLAPDKGLATLPISCFVIGTALSTVPASMLMRRVGRRPGFMIGTVFGLASALLCIFAIYERSFALFCLAALGQGTYQAFAFYYRFAAADTASPDFRPKAISWVLAGGVAGALVGPLIVMVSADWLAPVSFAGNYLASAAITAVALGIVGLLDLPHDRRRLERGENRPLPVILSQPRLLVAILCGMMAYGMMNLLMTATPIAMLNCGFTVTSSAWVIQWHALAMYLPSFFTGSLILRFGLERLIAIGLGLLVLAAVFGLAGIAFANFAIGLVLLGLGWNFGFVGGSTMVTECYHPAERNKVQAVNDFAVFATVALASLLSGQLLEAFGWSAVNLAVFPMALACAAGLGWLVWRDRRMQERNATI